MTIKHTAATEARDLRALLTAVLDALTLPHDLDDYDARVLRRAGLARVVAGEALKEASSNLGWNVDYLRSQLVAEQHAADERAKNKCRCCSRSFDPTDTAFDGRSRYRDTPWCRSCVDNCHEGGTEHVCVICDPKRYGGETR